MALGLDTTVLLATGFVDGRGGSKMCSWFYDELRARGYRVVVATNSMYRYKLDDLDLSADIVIDIHPSTPQEEIYQRCIAGLEGVEFDLMVSMGWRTYWPYAALRRQVPYVIVDGGVPGRFGEYPAPFIREVYSNSALYLATTCFPWDPPAHDVIPRLRVVTQPYPATRVESLRKLRDCSKAEARRKIAEKVPEIAQIKPDLMVYLNMSDACIDPFNYAPNNRNFIDPYGNELADYMDGKEVEPCLFFLFNLIAGLETNYPGRVLLYLMQEKTKLIAQSVLGMCKKVTAVAPKRLNLDLDPWVKKAADVNICRAANCDNQAELALIGEPCITSIVPRNYMDEDTAAEQSERLGLTLQIPYDDPNYIGRLQDFVAGRTEFCAMQRRTAEKFDQFWESHNFWKELFAAF